MANDIAPTALSLKDPLLLETHGYVDGAWVETAKRFAVHDPATGTLIANVCDLDI